MLGLAARSPLAYARQAMQRVGRGGSRQLGLASAATLQSQPAAVQPQPLRQRMHSTIAAGLRRGKRAAGVRAFSSFPPHQVVNMPALSPTMEVGSISRWSIKEGEKFVAGQALCEVETDKATVTFDATDEGYVAKILVGNGEIKVGQPIMVTVEDEGSVGKFASFTAAAGAAPASAAPAAPAAAIAAPAAVPKAAPVAAAAAAAAAASVGVPSTTSTAGGRVFASPLARKLARELNVDISRVRGTGPNGRIVAEDVKIAPAGSATAVSSRAASAGSAATLPGSSSKVTATVPGVYQDFEMSELGRAVASRYVTSKLQVPHYYLSVELDLTRLARLREDLNHGKEEGKGFSLMDFLVKATALAVRQVPDANAAWMDTFVRRYEQVDVNIVVGSGAGTITPVLRDVGKKGLKALSAEIADLEENLFADDEGLVVRDSSLLAPGTISIHNLGMFGVKAASPIILAPQACALALGAVIDTVVPNPAAKAGEDNWTVAPIMVATLSCDHRVIDGAVAAQYLQALKLLVENPAGMIL